MIMASWAKYVPQTHFTFALQQAQGKDGCWREATWLQKLPRQQRTLADTLVWSSNLSIVGMLGLISSADTEGSPVSSLRCDRLSICKV